MRIRARGPHPAGGTPSGEIRQCEPRRSPYHYPRLGWAHVEMCACPEFLWRGWPRRARRVRSFGGYHLSICFPGRRASARLSGAFTRSPVNSTSQRLRWRTIAAGKIPDDRSAVSGNAVGKWCTPAHSFPGHHLSTCHPGPGSASGVNCGWGQSHKANRGRCVGSGALPDIQSCPSIDVHRAPASARLKSRLGKASPPGRCHSPRLHRSGRQPMNCSADDGSGNVGRLEPII